MRADRRDPTIAALRKYKPHKFTVTLRDGTTRNVPLATKQNRWELLSETLDVMPWATIEALDESGSVLGCIERESEDLDDDDDGGDAISDAERIAKIMLHVMVTTQSETRKMFSDSMRANGELTARVMEAMHVVQESYSMAMKIQATALSGSGPGEGDNVMEMMKMAMMMKFGGGTTPSISPPSPPVAKPKPPTTNHKPPNGA